MPSKKPKDKPSLSEMMLELEAITDWFESGSVDLDEGIKKYEHGLELTKQIEEQLSKHENKIKTIAKKFDQG